MTNLITKVSNTDGDYSALYLNGKLVFSESTIPAFELQDITSKNQPFVIHDVEIEAEWLEDEGGFYPNDLKEIPRSVVVLGDLDFKVSEINKPAKQKKLKP